MMNFSLVFLLIISSASICMFLDLPIPANASGNESTDELALIAFKSQIDDDPLTVLVSWNHSTHFCNWTGVQCGSRAPRVTGLNLTGANLAGTISPHVGNFSFVELVDLSGNTFQGEIPWEIGNLGRLQVLNMSHNSLGGQIPGSLSNCTSLRSLALDHNYLVGVVPAELGMLSRLITLRLGTNNLTGNIPFSIGNITSLRELSMAYNNLHGEVPSTISQLRNLQEFSVSVNDLSGEFPPSLYNLTSLEFIALSFNNFIGNIRNDIGLLLPNLQRIWLPYNSFTGPIPDSFSNASNLQNIDLLGNRFTGKVPQNLARLDLLRLNVGFNHLGNGEPDDLDFINSLTNCSNLNYLHFGDNQFGGALPVSIANLSTRLTRLYLYRNSIHGTIPREISNLQNLNILEMNANNLNGSIPDSLGMLPNLGQLILTSNQLTGEIPSSIGNLTGLMWLFLSNNRLEGGIPLSLADCRQMVYFSIGNNNLIGTIPPALVSIPSLLWFNVSHNLFTGPLPENVGNSSDLDRIDLSYNNFSGEIPNSIGNCLAVNRIFLQGNSFQGRIPNIARLETLAYLDLSSNNLSGNIPGYLARLDSFVYLNLSYNNFQGEVPSTGVFSNVSAIDFHENPEVCGGIPELNLPACHRKVRIGSWKLILIIVLPSSFAALSFFLLLIFLIKRRLKNTTDALSKSFNFYPKISYEELLNATNGFSSENLVGSGSFGTVYKGTLKGITVAIKVLNLEKKGASRSFISECQALRNIRHYNLVKVITACSSTDFHGNDFKALVYQFMTNGNLDEWLHECNSLNILQRLDIAVDVASALHYLHHECQTPVIHCDLKPQNILLDSDIRAHVGDFGLARIITRFSEKENVMDQFSSAGVNGTIGYAAPEYGMAAQASVHGDVYSFGILLLEIFTGKRPTDVAFQESANFHHFVRMAVPERVLEILDNSSLCKEVTGKAETWEEGWISLSNEQQKCLIYVIQLGVACSVESPKDRISMSQVYQELVMIRDMFIGTGFKEEKPSSLSYSRDAEYDDEAV